MPLGVARSPRIYVPLGTLPGGGGGSGPVTAATSLQASLTNGDGTSHTVGMLLYLSADSTVRKAIPNGTIAQATVYAIAIATVAAGAVGLYAIWGQVSGLAGGTFNTLGFLGLTSLPTTTVPTVGGGFTYSVQLGTFQSAAILDFAPQQPYGPL